MSRIRTTAHPVILSSTDSISGASALAASERIKSGHPFGPVNVILTAARDLWDRGDTYGWAMELLYTAELLRMAYDSPRIGGGIDPALATNLPAWDDAVGEGGMLAYIVGDPQADPTDLLAGIDTDRVQDMIVHAEAVADGLIRLCVLTGTDY